MNGFRNTFKGIVNKRKMDEELAALKGGSQVFDRSGKLAAQLAEREAAIRAKYGDAKDPFDFNRDAAPESNPAKMNFSSAFKKLIDRQKQNVIQAANNPDPAQLAARTNFFNLEKVLASRGLMAPKSTQPTPMQVENTPVSPEPMQQVGVAQNPSVGAPPDIGLINRTMQRQAPQGGLLAKAFGLSTVSAANTQRQDDIAQRLGGQPQQIDFDGLKQKFRGKV